MGNLAPAPATRAGDRAGGPAGAVANERVAVLGWGVSVNAMMDTALSLPLDEDFARRERAKERLYVACQLSGWTTFFALQVFFTILLGSPVRRQDPIEVMLARNLLFVSSGLLLTHGLRWGFARWGWKQLGWKALFPRMLGTAGIASALWTAFMLGFTVGILREGWPARYSPSIMVIATWFNSASILFGWQGIYFFYHVFDRLNRSDIERLRLMTAAKESELRALKSQVNPHFIFNSLNSLRALIDENPARARQSVTQLANLLRYSLQSSQLETVPFEDELRVVNDYLALEQVRHEERLRLRLDIAPETLGLPLPPMLLQTLVENAVKYGISQRADGGEIAIIARSEPGFLRLQVTNPGELASISAVIPTAGEARRPASTGLGLKNAAERLRLLFGEHATLQLRAEKPSLVVAEAIIPLRGGLPG